MMKIFASFMIALVFLSGSVLALSSISGNANVKPNTQETYVINLDVSYPIDLDHLDGTYSIRYANWLLVDKDDKVVKEGLVWETVQNNYQNTVILDIPDKSNRYAIVAIITERNSTYDLSSNQWIWGEEKPIERISLQLSNNPDDPVKPPINLLGYWWIIIILALVGYGVSISIIKHNI